jgi:anti-anti-sigma factor
VSATLDLTLSGEMTIYRAAELRQTLLAALSGSAHGLRVDLAAVSDIDSAGVQLLIAARRAAEDAGKTLTIGARSAVADDVFALLGLTDQLDCALDLTAGLPGTDPKGQP